MRRKRTMKEALLIKQQLAAIIKDVFDNNGQVITHEELATKHVHLNTSLSAAEDVQQYGGIAAALLRRDMDYAIVPVTGLITHWTGNPANEEEVANTVAGLGAGGPRAGWYHPTNEDDWLWVFYHGHRNKSGAAAIFHSSKERAANPGLTSTTGETRIATEAKDALPAATDSEKKVLTAVKNRR